jgi:hypothetical protein
VMAVRRPEALARGAVEIDADAAIHPVAAANAVRATMSALDEIGTKLMAGLRAAIERELLPHLDAVARARAALDAYEAAVRRRVEVELVRKAASALGVEVDADDHAGTELEELERAFIALRAINRPTSRVEDPPAAETPPLREVAAPETVAAWIAAQNTSDEQSRPSLSATEERLRQQNVLRTLLERVGDPRELSSDVAQIDEMDALDEISSGDELARWDKLSRDQLRVWLTHLVARARHLKERSALNTSIKNRLREVIVRFPEYASDARPGHINGMRPDHEPVHGSWSNDVRVTYDELLSFVERRRAEPDDARPARKSRPSKLESASTAVSPIEWKYRERVASMRIVMFGGSRREDARANVELALGIGTLEWAEGDKPRRVDALADAIARGGYDVFLLLRSFVTHTDADKLIGAAKRCGTPFAQVDAGYGVEAVRAAIETALDAHDQRTSAAS